MVLLSLDLTHSSTTFARASRSIFSSLAVSLLALPLLAGSAFGQALDIPALVAPEQRTGPKTAVSFYHRKDTAMPKAAARLLVASDMPEGADFGVRRVTCFDRDGAPIADATVAVE